MKKYLFIVSLFLLTHCDSKKSAIDADKEAKNKLKRTWMLVELKGFTKSFLITNAVSLDLTGEEATIYGGCNKIKANFDIVDDETISFDGFISTKMFCEKTADLEIKYVQMLEKSTIYNVEGHQLTLSTEKGKTLKFIAQDWD
ncbi:MAG TPA: META domain-containing protein [Flavobacterium sp.]|nr:META domain-containing protein [Flavobacterium sp.]